VFAGLRGVDDGLAGLGKGSSQDAVPGVAAGVERLGGDVVTADADAHTGADTGAEGVDAFPHGVGSVLDGGNLDGRDAWQVSDAGVEVIAEREVGGAGVVVDRDRDRYGGVDASNRPYTSSSESGW
jgi:hypothetical protein